VPYAEAEIVELADRIVRSGFSTRDEAVAEIVQVMSDGSAADFQAGVEKAVDRALVAQDHEERMWGTTDNDRLGRAAFALEANGVLFRQNFACCQSCGFSKIPAEVNDAAAAGRTVRGFVFFHWNDTERAIDGDGLSLSYAAIGSFDPDAYTASALALATEVVDALRREGLQAVWPGHLDQRITLPLRWQRRRFTAPPQ
jgi:hypothetical protein